MKITHKARLCATLKNHGTWATKKEIEKWIVLGDWPGNADTYFRRARELCADGIIEKKEGKYDEYRYVGIDIIPAPVELDYKRDVPNDRYPARPKQDTLLKVDYPQNRW